jgi:hypothetical protein
VPRTAESLFQTAASEKNRRETHDQRDDSEGKDIARQMEAGIIIIFHGNFLFATDCPARARKARPL